MTRAMREHFDGAWVREMAGIAERLKMTQHIVLTQLTLRASGESRTRNPRITNAVLCQLKLRWLDLRRLLDRSDTRFDTRQPIFTPVVGRIGPPHGRQECLNLPQSRL